MVAIKQLITPPGGLPQKELDEFEAEMNLMRTLRPHANVVQFLGYTLEPELCIIARTNAGVIGLEEVIARVQAYEAAGADAICLVGIDDFEQLEQVAEKLKVPLMLVTYGNPRLRDNARLADLGVRIVVNGHAAYFAAIKATYDCLREQRQIDASDLNASQLSVKYSTAEEYMVWAEDYMQVKE